MEDAEVQTGFGWTSLAWEGEGTGYQLSWEEELMSADWGKEHENYHS